MQVEEDGKDPGSEHPVQESERSNTAAVDRSEEPSKGERLLQGEIYGHL